jgi:hypothetical protein
MKPLSRSPEMRQRGPQHPRLFVPGGNIPVAELGVQDRPLLGPKTVQRLEGLEPFVAVRRIPLVRLDQRGVRVQRRRRRRLVCLNAAEQRLIDLPQAAELLRHVRNDRGDGFRRGTVVKPLQPCRSGGRLPAGRSTVFRQPASRPISSLRDAWSVITRRLRSQLRRTIASLGLGSRMAWMKERERAWPKK